MNILVWCANMSVGGGTRLLLNLLPAMARQDDIDLVRCVVPSTSDLKERLRQSGPKNLEITHFDGNIQSETGMSLLQNCHVVYYFWPHTMDYLEVPRPTICTFHDTIILDYVPPFTGGAYMRQYWNNSYRWLSNVTSIVVSSHHVKSRLIAHFGWRCNAAAVIPHAILPEPTQRKSEWNLSAKLAARLPKEYLIYPANTSPHKNHYNLLLAYARFSQRRQYPLVLTGYLTEQLQREAPNWPDIQYLPTLTSIMSRTGLRVNADVYPLGFIPDGQVMPIIQHAKALVMPSLSEGGGSYPVEEALHLGVPVLCSDIPVMREHLQRHTADVIWFDPESPESMRAAFDRLMQDYAHYKQSAIQGMADASETWDDVARKYILVFRQAYLKYHGQ